MRVYRIQVGVSDRREGEREESMRDIYMCLIEEKNNNVF